MSESAKHHSSDETVFDVDVEKLARVYAQAGLDAAGDHQSQQALVDELNAVVSEVLNRHPELEKIFASALVSQDDKLGMLDRVFSGKLTDKALNFLKVIAKHGRLGYLRAVVRSANAIWTVRRNQVAVKLELAHPIDGALQQEMIDRLAKRLNAQPIVDVVINPDLIAGFVVRVGDRVLDASTRSNLERARQAMIAKAVETIQQRPHQFYQSTEA